MSYGKSCALCLGALPLRFKRCGGCKLAFYCSVDHAVANWEAHKPACLAEAPARERARVAALSAEELRQELDMRGLAAAAADAALARDVRRHRRPSCAVHSWGSTMSASPRLH